MVSTHVQVLSRFAAKEYGNKRYSTVVSILRGSPSKSVSVTRERRDPKEEFCLKIRQVSPGAAIRDE